MERKTIKNKASLEGVGLHTGKPSKISFVAAKPGSGIRFIRKDLPSEPVIEALLANVCGTVRGTNLGKRDAKVFTVEHVLSACFGLGIDDLDIEMEGPEPPAMDGSALTFASVIMEAGIVNQPRGEKNFISLDREVTYKNGNASYRAVPFASGEGLPSASGTPCGAVNIRVVFEAPPGHPLVTRQEFKLALTPETYMSDIAPARTFGFQEEIDQLRKKGLALGGSLDNAVVITRERFLTSGGLRFPDEMVRHKALDLLGDLFLTGRRFRNILIDAVCCGHSHNVNFARLLSTAANNGSNKK